MYDYLIRKKAFSIGGIKFHVYNSANELIGFCIQKAFKLKADFSIYTNESRSTELLNIKARDIIDFSACYDVFDSSTQQFLGSWRRKGWSSLLRDKWEVVDCSGNVIGVLKEDSAGLAFLRRFICCLIPQSYNLLLSGNSQLQVQYSQCFNPFVVKLKVQIAPQCQVAPNLVLAGGILLAAIEGKQM